MLWELIIGYLFTLVALLVPIVGLVFAGAFDWSAPGFRDWPLRGPYPADGAWAVCADVFCAAVVIVVATVFIAGSMEAGLKLPVSRAVVAVVVTATGVAPFFYAQLLPVSGPVSLLVAAFLIRRFAIDRFEPRRLRFSGWLLPAVLAAVAVVGVAVTVSFGVTHPLWAKDSYDQDNHVTFNLHNAGLARVKILSLSEPARLTFPVLPGHRRPVAGITIPAHKSRSISLLRRGCPPADLRVRYRIFGRTMSTRLRPKPPSCSVE